MNSAFDYFLKKEIPILVLCKPNLTPVASLKGAYTIVNTLRYNAISELTFDFPKSLDRGVTSLAAYNQVKNKMTVYIKDIGYFVIDECDEETSGMVPVKHVTCTSLESLMLHRRMTGLDVISIMLYNQENPNDSMLDIALKYMPNWSIDYVDPVLLTDSSGNPIRRQFKIDNSTLYSFLALKVEVAYNCVISFNYDKRTISAYAIDTLAGYTPEIFFSFNNINKSLTLAEYSDEMTTCLYCYGADNLDFRAVNPLGTNCIYNFDYYKNTFWMDDDLISALDLWENNMTLYQPTYEQYYDLLYAGNLEYFDLKTQLVNLQGELASLVTKYNVEQDSTQKPLRKTDVTNKAKEVLDKRREIFSVQKNLDIYRGELNKISGLLQFNSITNLQRFLSNIMSSNLESLSTFYGTLTYVQNTWKNTYSFSKGEIPDAKESIIPEITGIVDNNLVLAKSRVTYLAETIQNILLDYPLSFNAGGFSQITDIISGIQNSLTDYLLDIRNSLWQLIESTEEIASIDSIIYRLAMYNEIINYPSNLTESQYEELQYYLFENTYTNDYIAVYENNSPDIVKTQIESLYTQSIQVLSRAGYPRYEISGEFVNFISLPEYSDIVSKLDLGNIVTVEVEAGKTIDAALLEIEINYDAPDTFAMIFSNKVRLNKSNFQFADLFMDAAEGSAGVAGIG